ncbi:MAG: hypothetical protein QOK29_2337 [Rhodospirillaceae bacterium]|jgi:hypothetical protein|nr:hypothetical protein [Rhodospirillaceae bacterium]
MAGQDDMLAEHQRMWQRFCRLMTYTIIGAAVILIGMRIFLV